jgi:hypothetical protein
MDALSQQTAGSQDSAASPAGWRRYAPSWPLIMAVVAVLMAYRPKQLLADPDTYLHIAAGDWMLVHRALPINDPFSWSMAGAHWVMHEWLAELALAIVHDTFGWAGLALATVICFALAIGLMTHAVLRRLEPLAGLVGVFLVLLLLEPHLLARAHMLALPAMVAWCAALFSARDEGRGPPWAMLPVLVLWVNLHGSYMFGIALAGYLGLEAVLFPGAGRAAELKRWGGFVLAAIGCAFLSPNGLDGVLEPFRITAMPTLQTTFIEWRSPDFQKFDPVEVWLLGAIVLGFSTGIRLPPMRLLLLLGLFHLSLQHLRHEDLLAVVAPLALVGPMAPQLNAITRPVGGSSVSRLFGAPPSRAAAPAVALTLVVIALFVLNALRHPVERQDSPITPSAALAAARQAGASGRVLNDEHFGGYLVFCDVPVFIDGRIELYGDDFLKRYVALCCGDDPAALAAALDRDNVAWTMLPPEDRAAGVLDRLPGWRRVYADRFAVVHTRAESRH